MESWSLQDAKAKLSELVRKVKAEGPHIISLRGKPEIVMMTVKDFDALQSQLMRFDNIIWQTAERLAEEYRQAMIMDDEEAVILLMAA